MDNDIKVGDILIARSESTKQGNWREIEVVFVTNEGVAYHEVEVPTCRGYFLFNELNKGYGDGDVVEIAKPLFKVKI